MVGLLTLANGGAGICAPVSARDYVVLRKKLAAISLKVAKDDPASYAGRVVEIRGRVGGVAKSTSGSTLIICTAEQGSYLIDVDSPPVENPGVELACLVRVDKGCTHSLSQLRLVACTFDVELRRLEEAWNRNLATRNTASRGSTKVKTPARTQDQSDNDRVVSVQELVSAYKNAVKRFNPRLTDSQADTIARSILAFSYRYGVDARLVCAVILTESSFRITATSPKGAMGLGQLMPTTAAGLGVNNAHDPVENIYGSVRYIRSMLDRISGGKRWNELSWNELALALAAYNAGPGAVKKHGGIPPYRETQNYVRRVISIYKQLCGVK
ncbi:MAG: lytic transglycosylase domain-containing protein [Armatimonadota bacterium]